MMRKINLEYIIVGISIIFVAFSIMACANKEIEDAVSIQTSDNIADSAVHDYYVVSLEELNNYALYSDNSVADSGDLVTEERSLYGWGQIQQGGSDNTSDYCSDAISTDCGSDDNTDNQVSSGLDVWDMGLEWYGISYQDTTRTLKLITYEGYGYSRLSYYVACCCWARATEGYWGYGNLFRAFGQNDEGYDLWMDDLGIADWAYDALDECYRDPTYCMYCNGVIEPYNYMYAEWSEGDGCMIYCWND